jgi:hypothetical protein
MNKRPNAQTKDHPNRLYKDRQEKWGITKKKKYRYNKNKFEDFLETKALARN